MKFEFITSDPQILGGKPIIKNTRISVDIILEWIASGASIADINKAHPQLAEAAIKEAVSYASHFLHNELYIEIKSVA